MNASVLKTDVVARLPGVRIPPFPNYVELLLKKAEFWYKNRVYRITVFVFCLILTNVEVLPNNEVLGKDNRSVFRKKQSSHLKKKEKGNVFEDFF